MNESISNVVSPQQHIAQEVAVMCWRILQLLNARFDRDDVSIAPFIRVLEERSDAFESVQTMDLAAAVELMRLQRGYVPGALQRLVKQLELTELEQELFILAGLSEHHESLAELFRQLHPERLPYITAGLAAQLLCNDDEERLRLRAILNRSELKRLGVLSCTGSTPLFNQSVVIRSDVWSVCQGEAILLDGLPQPVEGSSIVGFEEWAEAADVQSAVTALRGNQRHIVTLSAENAWMGFYRALAVVEHAGLDSIGIVCDQTNPLETLRVIELQAILDGDVPVVLLPEAGLGVVGQTLSLCRVPIVLCGSDRSFTDFPDTPLQRLTLKRLSSHSLVRLWQSLLPDMQDAEIVELAAKHPMEPFQAERVVRDLIAQSKPLEVATIGEGIKHRAAQILPISVKVTSPSATWSDLVLPEQNLKELKDSINRIRYSGTVLDRWGFLNGQRGSRGVQLLLTGPPGVGKTLSAEVIASELAVDMFVVDLANIVSKWVGETEKNLAQIFDIAEQVPSVLVLNEADAIFTRRVAVSDGRDRDLNLETSYLLNRLETFEGMSILTTNYRQNIDAAFTRRLDYIIEYHEPSVTERLNLWNIHVPQNAPIQADVDFEALSRRYPMVGGQIRNAALSAAYFAAGENSELSKEHFVRGIEREYGKAGTALRELASA